MATITNQATLTYNGGSANSNIATAELVETLSMTKTAVRGTYNADSDRVTYVVTISNSGTAALTGMTLTDNLGAYTFGTTTLYPLSYRTDSILYYNNGTLQTAPAVTAGPPLVISGITVPAGGNATVIYEADVTSTAPLASGSTITNTAALSGTGLTVVSDTETVTVAAAPSLSINKAISPSPVVENGRVTYTFTIENRGNTAAEAADNLIITDTFDPILSDLAVALNGTALTSPTGYTYDAATGLFATVAGQITVPAATYTQDAATGVVTVTPGTAVLTVTGTL